MSHGVLPCDAANRYDNDAVDLLCTTAGSAAKLHVVLFCPVLLAPVRPVLGDDHAGILRANAASPSARGRNALWGVCAVPQPGERIRSSYLPGGHPYDRWRSCVPNTKKGGCRRPEWPWPKPRQSWRGRDRESPPAPAQTRTL